MVFFHQAFRKSSTRFTSLEIIRPNYFAEICAIKHKLSKWKLGKHHFRWAKWELMAHGESKSERMALLNSMKL